MRGICAFALACTLCFPMVEASFHRGWAQTANPTSQNALHDPERRFLLLPGSPEKGKYSDATLVANFQGLLNLLDHDGVLHQTDLAQLTVQISVLRGTLEGAMLIRWQEADGVIQFIQSLPLDIPNDKLGRVIDAVTRLNHVLAIPGLDVNQQRRLLAYRLYLPVYPRGQVRADEIQSIFGLTVKTASEMLPVLRRVISGQVKPENVVEDAQRELAAQASQSDRHPKSSPSKK